MAQEIRKMSILYPKTSKEFYHHTNFRKSIMNGRCSIKKLFLKFSQYSRENTCVGVSFLIKTQAFMPANLLKRDSNAGVFLKILQNVSEQLF